MKKRLALAVAVLAVCGVEGTSGVAARRASAQVGADSNVQGRYAAARAAARRRDDFAAMQTFRPGYAFWQHVFMLPDHSIAYGSAVDGRLLATFPTKGNWTRDAVWIDSALTGLLEGQRSLPGWANGAIK